MACCGKLWSFENGKQKERARMSDDYRVHSINPMDLMCKNNSPKTFSQTVKEMKEMKEKEQTREEWRNEAVIGHVAAAFIISFIVGMASTIPAMGAGLLFLSVVQAIGLSLVVATVVFFIAMEVLRRTSRKWLAKEEKKKFGEVCNGSK